MYPNVLTVCPCSAAGLFPFRTRLSPGQPHTEGYMQVQVQPGCPLLPEGVQLKGYFYSCCEVLEERVVGGFSGSLKQAGVQGPPVGVEAAGARQGFRHSYVGVGQGGAQVLEGYTAGTVLGSCLHVHFSSCPAAVQHLLQRCLRVDVASTTAAASVAAAAAVQREKLRAEQLEQQQQGQPVPGIGVLHGRDIERHSTGLAASKVQAQSMPDLLGAAAGKELGDMLHCVGYSSPDLQGEAACMEDESSSAGKQQQTCSQHAAGSFLRNKSSSIPDNMQQLGSQKQPNQQHGPFHVPVRWSLDLQRLGSSLTSQLLSVHLTPDKEKDKQEQQELSGEQQQQRRQKRGSSHNLLPLVDEMPLPEAASKALQNRLPVAGKTHHKRIGLACPLTVGSSVLQQQQQQELQGELDHRHMCHSASAASIHEQMVHMMAAGDHSGCAAQDASSSKAASYTTEGQTEDIWREQQQQSEPNSHKAQQQQQRWVEASCHPVLRTSVDIASLQHNAPVSAVPALRRSSLHLVPGESGASGGTAASLVDAVDAGGSSSASGSLPRSPADSIISLSPAATDMLLALGLRPRLAGVTEEDRAIEVGGWSGMEGIIQPWVAGGLENSGFSRLQLLEGVPMVCHSAQGPAGPQWQVDEQALRIARPRLVVVPGDEEHVSSSSSSSSAIGTSSSRQGRHVLTRRLAQRALKRSGVLWPESGAVMLYHECHTLCEVLEFLAVVADTAGVPERAVQLLNHVRQRLRVVAGGRAAARSLPCLASRPALQSARVLVLESINPLVVSGRWVPELLQLAGGTGPNAVWAPTPGQLSAEVGWSLLRQWAPEVVVIAVPHCTAASAMLETPQLAMQPGWWAVPAVQAGAVFILDESLLCRPGLELVLGAEVLGHVLQPDTQKMPQAAMGRVLQLCLHGGQRCRPRLLPNYFNMYCG